MYPDEIVIPCRKEMTDLGAQDLRTAGAVDDLMQSSKKGTTLLVVNSVCGCAAGAARPAVRKALEHDIKPDRIATVFAGVDTEATARARGYMAGFPPSSPSMALFKDGELVLMVERSMIEGRYPEQIAAALTDAFDTYCNA